MTMLLLLRSASSRGLGRRITRLLSAATTAILMYMILAFLFNDGSILPAWADIFAADTPIISMSSQDGLQVAIRDEDYGRISNHTLGFEKVIAIGLQERSDKRDAMTLMSALTGFNIEWVEGVKPSSISQKAIPYGVDSHNTKENFLGSWRGHMDALRKVVDSGYASALIIEDDMDWDVHLKGQLDAVARGARHILHDYSSMPASPYGDEWDLLWLGHCGEMLPETLQENAKLTSSKKSRMSAKYIIKNDQTVPPLNEVSQLVDWSKYPAHTRVVHMTAAPICTFAYAVTQSGARKLLYALSVNGLRMSFDNSLAQLCRDSIGGKARSLENRGMGLNCVSVNPTIMFHHRAKGFVAGDSDIQSYGKDGSVREKGMTESIKWSMRLNLENVLMGKPLEAQFREHSLGVM